MMGTGRSQRLETLRPKRIVLTALLAIVAFTLAAPVSAVTRDEVRAARQEAREAAREEQQAQRQLRTAQRNLENIEQDIARQRERLADLRATLADRLAEGEDEGGFFSRIFRRSREDLIEDINTTGQRLEDLVARRTAAEQEVAAAEQALQEKQQMVARKEQSAQQLAMELDRERVRQQPTEPADETPEPEPEVEAAAPEPQAERQPAKAVLHRDPPEPAVSDPIPWGEERHPQKPPVLAGSKSISPSVVYEGAEDAVQEAGDGVQFDVAMTSGDRDIVEALEAWKQWESYIPFNQITAEDIENFHRELTDALHREGYVFAKVEFPTRIWQTGIFLAKVDAGPLGAVVVRGHRHYSAEQIVARLGQKQGRAFNYAQFYQNLYDLNARPDLRIDTRLRPVIQDGRRVINAELEVQDSFPIHGALRLSNTGTSETSDWRIQTTLQHVNLTKRDDVLTVDWLTSPDLDEVNAYTGSYFLPFGQDYSLNLFGGYSSSAIDDVLPLLDVRGRGRFAGGQVTKTVFQNPRHQIQLSGGWLYQRLESRQVVGGVTLQDRDIEVSMPMLTVGYTGQGFDAWHGRNFASNTMLVNFAGQLGSSPERDFNAQGAANTTGDFLIDRFQLARFQRLFHDSDRMRNWSLYMKLDGQISTDAVIPQLRKPIGGADTVRGYREQETAGDDAVVASLELRTPLWQNFLPPLQQTDEFLEDNPDAWQRHRMQFLVFGDYGYARLKDPLPGEQRTDAIWAVGAGLRLGVTPHANLRFDVGVPLSNTENTESGNPRGHLSFQLQF